MVSYNTKACVNDDHFAHIFKEKSNRFATFSLMKIENGKSRLHEGGNKDAYI